jgi:hypothetical protein
MDLTKYFSHLSSFAKGQLEEWGLGESPKQAFVKVKKKVRKGEPFKRFASFEDHARWFRDDLMAHPEVFRKKH